jgi:hypothetical protein
MHIHSISRLLALPLAVAIGAILYSSYNNYNEHSIFIFIPVVLLVALYVFHGPLDHWWLSRCPIPFDKKIQAWLEAHFTPYSAFSPDEKKRFEYRLTLYTEGRLFQSVGKEMQEVPEDIKAMIAAHGVEMCLYMPDYLIGDMDRIFLYKHPFPSPAYPFLHSVETHAEDGVLILSLEQAVNAVLYPTDYYNVIYHAYAEAVIDTQKNIAWPALPDDGWSVAEQIGGWKKDVLCQQAGFDTLPLLPVFVTLFFSRHDRFQLEAPALYASLHSIFRNPTFQK